MSVTSGFFNSVNGDRRYNAEQMSSIFDGIINDGVFANVGTSFGVRTDGGMSVTVGVGRAWFNSTWLLNDSILLLTLKDSDMLLNRIDAVIIEIDRSESKREGSIKIIEGEAGTNPKNPTMKHTGEVNQYPLAYIYRKANSNSITQADITNAIGTSSTPYITGILQVQSIDSIVAQWKSQWTNFYNSTTSDMDTTKNTLKTQWQAWYNEQTTEVQDAITLWTNQWNTLYGDTVENINDTLTLIDNQWNAWFDGIKASLDENVATNLFNMIHDVQNELEKSYTDGVNIFTTIGEVTNLIILPDGGSRHVKSVNTTKYIQILPDTQYIYFNDTYIDGSTAQLSLWEDTNIGFIERVGVGEKRVFTTPVNCNYIRVSYNLGDHIKIERGSVHTTWTPSPEDILKDFGGVNLIEKSNTTDGYLLNEDTINSVLWSHTNFIPISPNTKYITSGFSTLGNLPATCFYDVNKNFISGIDNSVGRDVVTSPSNAAFMKFSFLKSDINTIKLERGTIATDWTPAIADIGEHIFKTNKIFEKGFDINDFVEGGLAGLFNNSLNLPSQGWYYIFNTQYNAGHSDSIKQFAYGYNTHRMYTRYRLNKVWTEWVRYATTDLIPTTLPANGGNAATVGGKLPSAFANASHTHTVSQVTNFPTNWPASKVTAGTLPAGVKATSSTDYTTSRLRNARFGTTVPTSLSNGEIFFVYE